MLKHANNKNGVIKINIKMDTHKLAKTWCFACW